MANAMLASIVKAHRLPLCRGCMTSEVTDDYTIMAMVEEGLGVSMLYRRTVEGMQADIRVRPIVHAPSRDVVAAWRSWDTMPIATRRFIDYMSSHIVN